MDAFLDFMNSNTVWALIVSVIIFIVTLVLVVKRLIGFFITLLLLFFTIASGYAILNHDIVRAFLLKYYFHETPATPPATSSGSDKMKEAYDKLKQEFEEQKQKFQDFMKQHEQKQKEEPKKQD